MKNAIRKKAHDPYEYQSLRFHPYNIVLTLSLFGVMALFAAFSAAFIYTRVQNPDMDSIPLPVIFYFNTFVLLGSSWGINWARKAYLSDSTEDYQKALLFTIAMTIIFMVGQVIGWNILMSRISTSFLASPLSSYLYLISGVHFAHLIAGLPFLMLFYYAARKRMKEPVSVLVYFSDPEKQLKLKLLTSYWHFLDLLWIYLMVFFLVNSLV